MKLFISTFYQGFGCILADYMGLGKTLQVIAVLSTFLTDPCPIAFDEDYPPAALVLAPNICVRNWENELRKWLGRSDSEDLGVFLVEASTVRFFFCPVTLSRAITSTLNGRVFGGLRCIAAQDMV
jgi:hypothetical protein